MILAEYPSGSSVLPHLLQRECRPNPRRIRKPPGVNAHDRPSENDSSRRWFQATPGTRSFATLVSSWLLLGPLGCFRSRSLAARVVCLNQHDKNKTRTTKQHICTAFCQSEIGGTLHMLIINHQYFTNQIMRPFYMCPNFLNLVGSIPMSINHLPHLWCSCLYPPGKLSHNYGKSPCSMGKSTISTGPCSIAMLVITRGYNIFTNG